MPSSIRIGSRVSGLIGPLLPLYEGQKRRKRQRFFGIVIRSVANHSWTVYWPEIDRCADHSFNSLKHEGSNAMGIDGIDIEATMSSKYLGKDQRAIDMFLEMWQPPATPLPEPNNATVALPPTPEATEAPSLNEASESTTNASTANRSEPSKYLPSNATTVPTPPSEPSIPNAQCNDSSTATTETENTSTEASEAVSPSPSPPTNPNVQDSVVTEE